MKYVVSKCPGRLGRGTWITPLALLLMLGSGLCALGCSAPEDEATLIKAIAAGGDHQDWDAVRPALRDQLQEKPDCALSHYYYGLSFLHQETPQLTFAEGEFMTSLHLLNELETFPEVVAGMTRDEFVGQLHRKIALVYMRGYREALKLGLPASYREDLLRRANAQVNLGLKANPVSVHLKEYAEFLRSALGLDGPNAPKIVTGRQSDGIAI